MTEALQAINALFATGANGAIIVLAYVAIKHELRITKLEGAN